MLSNNPVKFIQNILNGSLKYRADTTRMQILLVSISKDKNFQKSKSYDSCVLQVVSC